MDSFKKYILTTNSLKELQIVRNCFEKTCHLNTEELWSLTKCSQLTHLTIIYSRNMTDNIVKILDKLPLLEYINLKYATV